MNNLFRYSGIAAKIHAMHSDLLTLKDFETISNFSTVDQVVTFLKVHPDYMDAFSSLDERKLHRIDIEKILIQALYKDYAKLYNFSGREQRKFLKLYLKRYEVNLINYCFRIIFNHYDEPFDLNYKRFFFDRFSSISIDRLITSTTIEELVENLKNTPYYIPLKKVQKLGKHTLFDYDLALNLYYYTSVWTEKNKFLKGEELKVFTEACGSEIDLLNLQWIYRGKKYYNMNFADVYDLLVPIKHHIPYKTLHKLIETKTTEQFLKDIKATYYGKRYAASTTMSLEQMYKHYMHRLYMAERRKFPYSIAIINSYLFQKEEEINSLTTALECIRYKLPPRELLSYIGGVT